MRLSATAAAVAAVLMTAIGAAADPEPGINGKVVTIGSFGPVTGPASAFYVVDEAVQAHFDMVNARGGVNGYTFKYIVEDDQYNPSLTGSVVRKLIDQDRIFAVVGGLGTGGNEVADPILEAAGIPNVGAASGSPTLTEPTRPLLWQISPSYKRLGAFLADYATTKLHASKIAVFYQRDDFGIPALAGITEMLKKRGITLLAEVPYTPADVDFAADAAKLKASGADTVISWATPNAFASIAKAMADGGFKPTLLGPNFAADPNIIALSGGAVEGAYFSMYLPPLHTPATKDVEDGLAKYAPALKVSPNAESGWTYASVFIAAVAAATKNGQPLTRAALTAALNNMHHFSNGVIGDLEYSPSDHRGVTQAAMQRIVGGKFVPVSSFSKLPD